MGKRKVRNGGKFHNILHRMHLTKEEKVNRKIKKHLRKERKKVTKHMSKGRKKIKKLEKQKENRIYIKTGITGFDTLIKKGIEKGTSILISGGPGSGKTIFALQSLYNGALKNEKGLYISFEEDPEKLRQHMIDFGWDIKKIEEKGLIKFVKYDPFKLSRVIEGLLMKAKGQLAIKTSELPSIFPKGFLPDRIVIDSLSALEAAFFSKQESYRIYIEQLFTLFSHKNVTSFLITETEQDSSKYSKSGVEEFLADGVIVIYNIKVDENRVRSIEILKLRGAEHEHKLVPFEIRKKGGIFVYPKEHVFLGGK